MQRQAAYTNGRQKSVFMGVCASRMPRIIMQRGVVISDRSESAFLMRSGVEELLKIGFREENIWISEERKMCCGLGKCGHCKVGKTYICLDGPVFNYAEGKMLMD